jgi:hypothetical protein
MKYIYSGRPLSRVWLRRWQREARDGSRPIAHTSPLSPWLPGVTICHICQIRMITLTPRTEASSVDTMWVLKSWIDRDLTVVPVVVGRCSVSAQVYTDQTKFDRPSPTFAFAHGLDTSVQEGQEAMFQQQRHGQVLPAWFRRTPGPYQRDYYTSANH